MFFNIRRKNGTKVHVKVQKFEHVQSFVNLHSNIAGKCSKTFRTVTRRQGSDDTKLRCDEWQNLENDRKQEADSS